MNRILSLLAFVLLFSLAVFNFYFEASIFENTNKINVNIRNQPSIQSKVVGKIQPGKFVIGVKVQDNWSLVFVNSRFGYAYSSILSRKVIHYNNVAIRQKLLVSGILIILSLLFIDFDGRKDTGTKKKAQLPSLESIENHDNLSPEIKGFQFEKFIVTRLVHEGIVKLMRWRGDKYIAETHIYAEDIKYPDIEALYEPDNKTFAVECKWRRSFFMGEITIGEPYKLNNYKEYQVKYNFPVFIAIGVGGLPSNPDRLFIVPLDVFESNTISLNELQAYEKKSVEDRIVFNSETESLT